MTRAERRRGRRPPAGGAAAKELDAALLTLTSDPGVVAVAFVDAANGAPLAAQMSRGGAVDSTTPMSRWLIPSVLDAMRDLSRADELDDVVIAFASHCHVARIVRSSRAQYMIAYAIVDRHEGSVALTRLKLWEAARQIAA